MQYCLSWYRGTSTVENQSYAVILEVSYLNGWLSVPCTADNSDWCINRQWNDWHQQSRLLNVSELADGSALVCWLSAVEHPPPLFCFVWLLLRAITTFNFASTNPVVEQHELLWQPILIKLAMETLTIPVVSTEVKCLFSRYTLSTWLLDHSRLIVILQVIMQLNTVKAIKVYTACENRLNIHRAVYKPKRIEHINIELSHLFKYQQPVITRINR